MDHDLSAQIRQIFTSFETDFKEGKDTDALFEVCLKFVKNNNAQEADKELLYRCLDIDMKESIESLEGLYEDRKKEWKTYLEINAALTSRVSPGWPTCNWERKQLWERAETMTHFGTFQLQVMKTIISLWWASYKPVLQEVLPGTEITPIEDIVRECEDQSSVADLKMVMLKMEPLEKEFSEQLSCRLSLTCGMKKPRRMTIYEVLDALHGVGSTE